MTNALATRHAELITHDDIPADHHPVTAYLASLSRGSLPAQCSAPRKIAEILGADIQSLNWAH